MKHETLRASQLNGCAFCVDLHVKEATLRGERALRAGVAHGDCGSKPRDGRA